MTDVRLTATTTDGEVVPVLSNTKGELLLEAPVAPPPAFDGNLDGDLTVSGSGVFAGPVNAGNFGADTGSNIFYAASTEPAVFAKNYGTGAAFLLEATSSQIAFQVDNSAGTADVASIAGNGNATFSGEVVIGSKGSKWLIRESNGVAMLVEQTRRQPRVEKVRDLPRELDLIESALNEIMEKLKMTPPAGWEVWDGSDNSQ